MHVTEWTLISPPRAKGEFMRPTTLVYIDGTNYLTELGKAAELPLRPEKPSEAILDFAAWFIHSTFGVEAPKRYYWFGSYDGSEEDELRIKKTLRRHRFEAHLFRRRARREKGVDISLTKEMLVNAFHHNCERSVLIAGDEDYVSLVNEVKRYGQVVEGRFFASPTSPHLELALDHFITLDNYLAGPAQQGQLKVCKNNVAAASKPAA